MEGTLLSWDEIFASIFSLDIELARRILREGQELKIEDQRLQTVSQSLQRLKQSELDKLIQEKTIAHIGNVIEFIQQLTIVYLDYGHCVPAFEAVEEALNQNLGIQPYLDHFG